MTDHIIETFHYELEERDGQWWTRFTNPDGTPAGYDWTGPYPTETDANEAVKGSLEKVITDLTKKALGLS